MPVPARPRECRPFFAKTSGRILFPDYFQSRAKPPVFRSKNFSAKAMNTCVSWCCVQGVLQDPADEKNSSEFFEFKGPNEPTAGADHSRNKGNPSRVSGQRQGPEDPAGNEKNHDRKTHDVCDKAAAIHETVKPGQGCFVHDRRWRWRAGQQPVLPAND